MKQITITTKLKIFSVEDFLIAKNYIEEKG